MKKSLLVFLLLYSISAFAQNIPKFQNTNKNNNLISEDIKFKNSLSFNILAGAFMPINFDEDYKFMLPAFSVGGQYNTSELFSLCMDLNVSITKIKKPIIQLSLGPKFHFLKRNNNKFFAKVEIGAYSTEDRKFLPLSTSIGLGYINKISNKLSLNFEISQNTLLSLEATDAVSNTFLLILGGISF